MTAADFDRVFLNTPLVIKLGASWRGRDCDDGDVETYPGRLPLDGDRAKDSDCNGISGKPNDVNQTYEELLCGGTRHYGVAILGDSAGAHFHMPEAW